MALIRYFSDMHLDTNISKAKQAYDNTVGSEAVKLAAMTDCFWVPEAMPFDKETILVLAGDLFIKNYSVMWKEFSWLGKLSQRFKAIVIVLGNHDFWDYTLDAPFKMRNQLQDIGIYNVHILQNQTIKIDDVVFIGATLWTDMEKEKPLTVMRAYEYMAKDFEYITKANEDPFRVEDWLSEHKESVQFIAHSLEQYAGEKCVVVTHHAPSFKSIHPWYQKDAGNGFYYSDLENLIFYNPWLKYWIHGHIHAISEYKIGETTVLCNPVMCKEFDDLALLDV